MKTLITLLTLAVSIKVSAATVSEEARDKSFKKAIVWQSPATPIENADMTQPEKPLKYLDENGEITCQWNPNEEMNGMTPKFYCVTQSGKTLKVKYHKGNKEGKNKEIPSEVAGTRLLSALGFGADRMYLVSKVHCVGCPKNPFSVTTQLQSKNKRVVENFLRTYGTEDENGNLVYIPDYSKSQTFEYVAIERKLSGKTVRTEKQKGFGWNELKDVDTSLGGATRAEKDALRLMVRFLMNSDIKSENQRLKCLVDLNEDGTCDKLIAYMQDVGVGFAAGIKMGLKHTRVNVEQWKSSKVFADSKTCLMKMSTSLTGSFDDVLISEEGRVFLSSLLERLSDNQIRDLFEGARFPQPEKWVEAFKEKRAEITNHSGCPQ